MKISDILWEAANVHLASDWFLRTGELFSCCAVSKAANTTWSLPAPPVFTFLKELGCDINSPTQFHDFTTRHAIDKFDRAELVQNARYLWLMFAYQVALDEGI